MRTFAIAVGVLLGAAAVGAAQDPAAAANEQKRMTGYWKPVSVQYDGKEQLPTAAARDPLTLVIKDGEYRMYYRADPKDDKHFRLFTADLKLDPSAKTFELNVKDGQKKDERRHGIYEFNGSQLKICYGPADQPRPTAFAAPARSGFFCEEWAPEKR